MNLRMPPQIVRLVLLAASIVATYVVARYMMVPRTFGQYGHYRGAALELVASRPPVFAGAKSCDECHADTRDLVEKFEHRRIYCEACHGPSKPHVIHPDLTTLKLDNDSCMRCHTKDTARPGFVKQVKAADHFAGDKCLECHLPHQPNKEPK